MKNRTVIIGNGGSGKSYLARRLAQGSKRDVIHLDRIFWVPGGFNEKRSPDVVARELEEKKLVDSWIVEGVFGELAVRFLERADRLIWLDLPWEVCRASLLARGSESAKQLDPVKAEANFQQLLAWVADYWTRTDLRSHAGHGRLYADFSGEKIRFDERAAVDRFIAEER